ncbi:hypothetical protein [Aureibacillus halotolerans]|uniref:Sporulation protein YpjB n=1 Tax=Aureibacillus halotolerans TaxID=1508390 RepID=A0A4R6U7A6_9BACI|nr:hypothetical protein [Aureibacillus halotolerans]TDQ42221.1 hypothetical protein EV213_102252 [Aureibacillus halotolerans]
MKGPICIILLLTSLLVGCQSSASFVETNGNGKFILPYSTEEANKETIETQLNQNIDKMNEDSGGSTLELGRIIETADSLEAILLFDSFSQLSSENYLLPFSDFSSVYPSEAAELRENAKHDLNENWPVITFDNLQILPETVSVEGIVKSVIGGEKIDESTVALGEQSTVLIYEPKTNGVPFSPMWAAFAVMLFLVIFITLTNRLWQKRKVAK